MKDRQFVVTVLVLLLASAVSRFFLLGGWTFDGDEFFTVNDAHERYWRLLNPLFYQLYLLSTGALGVSEWSARLPSAVLGALGPVVVYAGFARTIGHSRALLAALFLLFHGWHLWHSQYARYYSGVVLLASCAYAAYWYAMVRNSLRALALFALAAAVAFFVHVTAAVVVAGCAAHALFVLCWPRISPELSRRVAKVVVASVATMAVAAIPVVVSLVLRWHEMGQTWGYGPLRQGLQLVKYFELPLIAAGSIGALLAVVRRDPLGLFVLCGALLALGACVVGAAFMALRPDYVIAVLPLVCLGAAALIFDTDATPATLSSMRRWGIAAVLLLVQMPAFVSHYTERASLDLHAVVRYLDKHRRPDDQLVSFVNGIDYYLRPRMPRYSQPADPFDSQADWPALLERHRVSTARTWLLLPYRRAPLADGLERWLTANASLRWRRTAERFDYTVHGYQLFLVEPNAAVSRTDVAQDFAVAFR